EAFVIQSNDPQSAGGQQDLVTRTGEGEIADVIDDEVLGACGGVDAVAADEPRLIGDVRVRSVAVDTVLPFELVAERIVIEIGGRFPGIEVGFPEAVGDGHLAAVVAGKDADVESQTAPLTGDARK